MLQQPGGYMSRQRRQDLARAGAIDARLVAGKCRHFALQRPIAGAFERRVEEACYTRMIAAAKRVRLVLHADKRDRNRQLARLKSSMKVAISFVSPF